MDSAIVKPSGHGNYENVLDKLWQDLLNSLQDHSFEKVSTFISRFRELLQCNIDPPLEIIWAYSALGFHSSSSANKRPAAKLCALKDSFQLICSHSGTCNSLKSIVLMAPVVYHLYNFILEFKGLELGPKKEKKLVRDIKDFSASVLGYMNVCHEGLDDKFDGTGSLSRPLEDLISLWMWDEETHNVGKAEVKKFFPLLSEDIAEKLYAGEYGMSELAGHVIAEAFLLRCCLTFLGESPRKELYCEMRAWAIGSVTVMQNPYLFDSLVTMLLQPPLLVTSLLSSEDEMFSRNVLYDTCVLPSYSFLHFERLAHLPAKHLKRIAMRRLVITHEAVELFRKLGDETKALSYVSAFSSSGFSQQLMKWVKSQINIHANANGPNGSSPKTLLRWILDIENHGVKIFDDDMSRYRAKLVVDISEEDTKLSAKISDKRSDVDLLFYIDKKGEEENGDGKDETDDEAVNAAFLDAAHSMKLMERGGRKRKVEISEEEKRTQVKYKRNENSSLLDQRSLANSSDRSSSESEVENPSSDEE